MLDFLKFKLFHYFSWAFGVLKHHTNYLTNHLFLNWGPDIVAPLPYSDLNLLLSDQSGRIFFHLFFVSYWFTVMLFPFSIGSGSPQ
jgi:hypothetical protein